MSNYQYIKHTIENMSDDEFKDLFDQYKSISTFVSQYFQACAKDPRIRKIISQRCNKLKLKFNNQPVICDTHIDYIRETARTCNSITELLYKLKLQPVGGNFSSLRAFLNKHEIMLASGTLNPQYTPQKWSKEKVYCVNSQFDRRCLRQRVLRDNILPYQCAICGNLGVWNNTILNLQIDHINGDCHDNRLENLRWLCPNCHSQTSTFGGRNQ